MSSYTKLVMIPMDMYNNIIGGAPQQQPNQQEIATQLQIPMNPPVNKKKKGIKRDKVIQRRQYGSYSHP